MAKYIWKDLMAYNQAEAAHKDPNLDKALRETAIFALRSKSIDSHCDNISTMLHKEAEDLFQKGIELSPADYAFKRMELSGYFCTSLLLGGETTGKGHEAH